MELDFSTFRALSSPTRIEILRSALNGDNTTTEISDSLDKSKSTVSDHLQKLTEAGLLEKEEVEGRKRVTYEATGKAKAIVEGRKRKVRFSIATGFVLTIAGTASVGRYAIDSFSMGSANAAQTSSDTGLSTMATESADAAREASEVASGAAQAETVFLAAGVFFLSTAALTFAYGYMMRKLEP